ncbi:MAG: DUF2523 family protein [Methylobacter sp.]|nr:DUF2523 family protein [Methylobacter sp.]
MSVFVDVVNAVVDVGQQVSDFIGGGAYALLTKFVAYFIRWFMVHYFQAKLAALVFSYDVAQQLMASLNVSAYLNTAWASLESRTLSMLVFFRIPDALNIILSASVTKFVFKFLGF